MVDNRGPRDWMITHTGKQYWPAAPHPDDVCIEDIAHGLAYQCRYAGQCRWFYSIAEHCVHVSYMVPPHLALEGLLHDASEAYCSDIVRPLKTYLSDYQRFERLNEEAIRFRFGLRHEEHLIVKEMDTRILMNEYATLFPGQFVSDIGAALGNITPHPNVNIGCWMPVVAEREFLARFKELYAPR